MDEKVNRIFSQGERNLCFLPFSLVEMIILVLSYVPLSFLSLFILSFVVNCFSISCNYPSLVPCNEFSRLS